MIDTHCHLNFHAFKKDYDAVIKDAFDKGVETIINVGTKIDSSQKAVSLANTHKNLYAIVGIHPHHADKHDLSSDWIKQLEHIAQQPKVVAIGEIGLDYFSYKSNDVVDPTLQKEVFEAQIILAHKLRLPLQIHNRHAGRDILEILKYHKNLLHDPPGMFHCFAGTIEVLKSALDMGFYIGFDGNITYPGIAPGETTTLSELVKTAPLERIISETDSPFLTPIPHRGARNIPSYVIIVGETIAKIKHIPFETVKRQTMENARKIFKAI